MEKITYYCDALGEQKVCLFHASSTLFTDNIKSSRHLYFPPICLLCSFICNTIHYFISMRSWGRLQMSSFQQNMQMTVYIKSKWSNNSPHYILKDIAYLDTKAHILSFPPPPSGVPLHKVCLLLVTFSTILSHLDHVQFHGKGFQRFFVIDCSEHYEFLSQLCLITQ